MSGSTAGHQASPRPTPASTDVILRSPVTWSAVNGWRPPAGRPSAARPRPSDPCAGPRRSAGRTVMARSVKSESQQRLMSRRIAEPGDLGHLSLRKEAIGDPRDRGPRSCATAGRLRASRGGPDSGAARRWRYRLRPTPARRRASAPSDRRQRSPRDARSPPRCVPPAESSWMAAQRSIAVHRGAPRHAT